MEEDFPIDEDFTINEDFTDIQKIESALGESISKENESEYLVRCESAEDYSPSEVSSYQQHLTPSNLGNSFSIFEDLLSEEENRLVISELEPCLENSICLNKAYRSLLTDLVQQLQILRQVNLHKQNVLRTEIEIMKVKENAKKPDKKKKKFIPFTYFGMPYFKDAAYNTPPPNADTLIAESVGFRNISLLLLNRQFSKFEVRRLRKGLRDQAIVIESTRLVKLRDDLQRQLNDVSISEDEIKDLQSQKNSIQRQIYNIRSIPDDKLFDLSPTAFDWNQISIQNFGRGRTPDQLRLHWMQYLRPGVNTSPWIHPDNKMLKELVSKYENGVDWNEVATNLNKGRTPFECFRRYQEKFNVQSRKFGWSNEDNQLLLSLISSYKTENISNIDWEEIRQNFPGRSKIQIYSHFRYHLHSLDPSPFSSHEDTAILEGIKIGYSLADISLLLGKRSLIQIRNRFKILMKKPRPDEKDWTEEEDKQLLEMLDVSKLRIHVIRKNFPGRSFSKLFSRFHYLRMKSTTPKQYIADLKDHRLYSETRYMPKVYYRKVASRIESMMSREGYNQDVSRSLLKKLPMLKNSLLNEYEEPNRKKRFAMVKNQTCRGKRVILKKEAELREILCPYIAPHTKRPRKLCFPGDGREHGIVFTCLYRLLQCNFTLAPNPNDLTKEKGAELGISHENYLSFIELMNINKDIVIPDIATRTGQLNWIPPSLGTLMGYRGLDLHRAYLQTSASLPFVEQENSATITELHQTDPMEGPSGQAEPIAQSTETEEPVTAENNGQQDVESDDEMSSHNQSDEIHFGDKIADSLLLMRLTTLFFWPGIMASVYVPDLTREDEDPTQDATEVDHQVPVTKVEDNIPPKKVTKAMRKQHLRQVALKRFGKCKALQDNAPAVSTTSVEELNDTAIEVAGASTSADGENSEAAVLPSTSAGPSGEADVEIVPPPAKKVKRTSIKVKEVRKSNRLSLRGKKNGDESNA